MDRYSVDQLLSFLDYVGKKGLMNETTARARKIASQKILSVLDASEKTDLRTLNMEELNTRFVNKFGRDFTPGSLQTYRQRFSSALDDFLKYVENPAAFKVSAVPRAARQATTPERAERHAVPVGRRVEHPAHPAPGLLSYPIPLASGAVAQLAVPATITRADADRILSLVSAMVNALATDEPE